MLCLTCQSIFRKDITFPRIWRPLGWSQFSFGERWFVHHESSAALNAAAEQGCEICSVLKDKFLKGSQQTLNSIVRTALEEGVRPEEIMFKLCYTLEFQGDDCAKLRDELLHGSDPSPEYRDVKFTITFFLQCAPLLALRQPLLIRMVPWEAREEVSKLPSMRSPEAFDRARAWLEKCLTSRTPCGGQWTPSHSKIPTRLLYVQDAHTCRLTEASELPADLRYLTLSHCWGSSATKTLCLTTQNMAALKTAVPLQHLSRVFQDALAVTRELGYHYLWIDSLCIVQDSLDDWRSESLRMGDVYKNSTCNLSSLGPDGSHGLLKSSRADEIPTLETLVEYRIRSGAGVMVPFLTGARYYGLIFDRAGRGTWRDVEEAPLNRRAWVLQERVLSPRILHFGHAQMFWECDHLCANELFPCGFDTTLYPFLAAAERATVFNRDLRSRVAVAPEWSAHVLGSFWDEVISAHSASSLTFPTDKLVSLAGLGREIESLFRKRYLSGMFPLDFPCSLLWTVAQPSGRHGLVLPVTIDRRPEQGAPSWSWASLDGAVLAWGSYQYNKRVVCCSRWTMVCTVSIADPLPTPQLDLDLGHRLAVRGSLRRFTPGGIAHAQELGTFCWTAPHRWTLKLFPDTGTFPLHSREPGPLWERHFAPFILSFFFLPFLQGKDRIDDLTELNFAAGDLLGLGLLPVDDAVGTYRRIGLVRLRSLAAEKNSTLEMPWTEFTTDDPIPQEPGGNGVYLTLV